MKKFFGCVLLVLFLFAGCSDVTLPYGDSTENIDFTNGYIFNDTTTKSYGILSCDNNGDGENGVASAPENTSQITSQQSFQSVSGAFSGEFRGVWMSYYEIDVNAGRNSKEKYGEYIDSLCSNFRLYGITDAFVHVRPYADAMYKSSVYPTSVYAGVSQGQELLFDPLEVICEIMGRYNIRVHAWINPYRVHNGTDINELSDSNKAKQWYNENSAEDVALVGGKIYFNPSSEKAKQLVTEGVREILINYPVAGIHIDDYFYPPDCGDFDKSQYEKYLSDGGTLGLDDWRRENVNELVRNLYATVKSFGGDRIFSISPAGNINNNQTSLYADVALWCKGGYADMIIPQIYFGFSHQTHPFEKCVADWYSLKGESVKMPVGLALYKSGQEDAFAGTGKNEWQQSMDIISRQVQHLRSRGCDGFAIFSTEFFLSQEGSAKNELDNLKSCLGY